MNFFNLFNKRKFKHSPGETIMEFKAGDKFKAKVPFGDKPMKVHICYVLPSTAYSDRTLIIYKVYGKHRQWWHELMCSKVDMEHYISMVEHYE